MQTFETALTAFINYAQETIRSGRSHPKLPPVDVGMEPGRKYIRITMQTRGWEDKSVYCFVEKETGLIFKAAGWKSPAKGARGSIFDAASVEAICTPWGCGYLR